jgi:hypothetical protein
MHQQRVRKTDFSLPLILGQELPLGCCCLIDKSLIVAIIIKYVSSALERVLCRVRQDLKDPERCRYRRKNS